MILQETFSNSVVHAEVVVSELLGSDTNLYCRIDDTEFICRVEARDFRQPGEKIDLTFNLNKVHFFDLETEKRIVK